jgi:hypothetical protein
LYVSADAVEATEIARAITPAALTLREWMAVMMTEEKLADNVCTNMMVMAMLKNWTFERSSYYDTYIIH